MKANLQKYHNNRNFEVMEGVDLYLRLILPPHGLEDMGDYVSVDIRPRMTTNLTKLPDAKRSKIYPSVF